MATIELHAAELNLVPKLLRDTRRSVLDYKSEIDALASRLITVSCEGIDLDDVISSLRQSSRTQDLMASHLESSAQGIERFAAEVSLIDLTAADLIRKRKQEFYDEHYYLKPQSEKSFLEKWSDFTDTAAEWCMDHWKEILLTAVIIVGAVLSIIAVVASGGLALVPLLGLLPFMSVSMATAISIGVAVIAVSSTVISSVMNIMDMWGDFSGNSTFQSWKSAMGWVALGSNFLYSVGNMYNAVKGVTPKEYIARQRAMDNGRTGYSNLDAEHPRMVHKQGADYDQTRKSAVTSENIKRNGVLRDDQTGKIIPRAEKSVKGVTPSPYEANIDHMNPAALGGRNSFDNAQVITRGANIAKGANIYFNEYLKYSVPDIGSFSNAVKALFNGNFGPLTNLIFGDD